MQNVTVAEDYCHISALALTLDSLLLTYQEPSGTVVIMLGHIDEDSRWGWRNETNKLDIHGPGVCSASRSASPYYMFQILCFMKEGSSYKDIIKTIYFSAKSTTPANLTIDTIHAFIFTDDSWAGPELNTRTSSDIAWLSDGEMDQIAWLNQSRLELYEQNGVRRPSPKTRFPFPYFASTCAGNSTDYYIYHQISDIVIGEELWDGGKSGFWISKNITID